MNAVFDSSTGDLLQLARNGCEESRGRLLEQFRKYLKTLARLQLHGRWQERTDASDLVQDTFLRAHQRFDQFRGSSEREFAAWLRSILASRFVDLTRHSALAQSLDIERQIEDSLEDSEMSIQRALVQTQSTPSEIASKRERAVLLASAIEDLPDDYRTVILLRNIQGLKYQQVAESMGRSVDSVKKLWVRALGQLQRAMEKYA